MVPLEDQDVGGVLSRSSENAPKNSAPIYALWFKPETNLRTSSFEV